MTLRYRETSRVRGILFWVRFFKGIAATQSRTEGPAMKIDDLDDDRDSYAD